MTTTDVWRTLKVWMDTAVPGDASGPELLLVTTQTAGAGTAVAALRPETLDERAALTGLEAVASAMTSEQTKAARELFLALVGRAGVSDVAGPAAQHRRRGSPSRDR